MSDTQIEAYDHALFPELLNTDPESVMVRFAERFMRAETLDDLFDALEGNLSRSLVGHKVRIQSVQWAPYQSDRGITPLAICQATDLTTGEETEFATTGGVLTMFIRRAELLDCIPFDAKIVGKRTSNGQTALNFERL
jgi:hypothetical protein